MSGGVFDVAGTVSYRGSETGEIPLGDAAFSFRGDDVHRVVAAVKDPVVTVKCYLGLVEIVDDAVVAVDGVAVRSCLMLAVQSEGQRIDTVEGLADHDGMLNDLQQSFKRHHALQCGFCTAGILMSCMDYLERVPNPSEQQVRELLSGHLCRCTGYTNIVNAVLDTAKSRAGA